MNLCVNDSGLTFSFWHEAAGYSLSWMARCDLRFFAMLHKAWRRGDNPDDWKGQHQQGALNPGDSQPWD